MRQRLSRVRAVGVVVVVLAGMVLTGCNVAQAADPVEMVPARANLLGKVDLPTILSDEDTQAAYKMIADAADDESMPDTLKQLLDDAEMKTGVTLSSFGEALVFGEVSGSSPEAEYIGFIVESPPDNLFSSVRGSGLRVEDREYRDEDLLESEDEDLSFLVLDDIAVIGTPEAVRDVIDVKKDGAPTVGGDVLDFYNELGDVWVKFAVDLPDDAADSLGDFNGEDLGMPVDLGSLAEIQGIGISGTKDGEDSVTEVVLHYATPEMAEEAATTVDALMTLMTSFSGDERLAGLADALSIEAVGTSVTIEYSQPVEEALAQLESMLSSAGSGDFPLPMMP